MMKNALLTEICCARMLAAALGGNFGLDIDNHVCSARRTVHGMHIQADATCCGVTYRFCAELDNDELATHSVNVMARLADQLQPQVFDVWGSTL